MERKLPPIASFALRMDSSLGEGAAVPQTDADAVAAEAVAASQEERCSTVEVALRLLPKLQALAVQHAPGQVLRSHNTKASCLLFCTLYCLNAYDTLYHSCWREKACCQVFCHSCQAAA